MKKQVYRIKGMDCADCALKIEKGVRQLAGVETARVDFATARLEVEGDIEPGIIGRRVEVLGYELERPTRAGSRPGTQTAPAIAGFWAYLRGQKESVFLLAGGGLLLVSALVSLAGLPVVLARSIQVLALVTAGYPVARGALVNLWINHDFNIQLLMTIAATGAIIIGETAESATLIFLFSLSEALEGYTSDRARRVLDEMGDLTPANAIRLNGGREEQMPVEQLRVGDEILIPSGERIPMDGVIGTGTSAVNQAPITGESLPVDKTPGDTVFAGTINGSGVLTVQVTRLAGDTTIQRIIHMIEQAQAMRAPTQRFIDRFARVYTPVMVVLAALVAVIPPLFFAQPFLNTADGTGWLYRALALLVIACPCALVISAPVTIISAITAAARKGVLIKGGAYLEALAGIRLFAFDKTGTLTRGQPVVTSFRSASCLEHNPLALEITSVHPLNMQPEECSECSEVLAFASALERRSPHPLARSVVLAAENHGLVDRYPPAQDVITLAGSGLQGHLNGKLATIGSHTFFDQQHPHQLSLCSHVEQAEQQGQTTMLVHNGDRVLGFIAVADTPREDSRGVIDSLHQMHVKTAMLTGDNPTVASAVSKTLGIDLIHAQLLPEEKVAAIHSLEQQAGPVAMVGDGINDTPALAAASLGIAVGGAGSAQAMETADIVLMGGNLQQLPFAVRVARFARRLIQQNVVISLGTKLIFILLALGGLTSLWLAVLADVGVSLAVTLNGMRANRL